MRRGLLASWLRLAATAWCLSPWRALAAEGHCGCQCCQVSDRLPSEEETTSDGQTLRFKCTTAAQSTDSCPEQCEADGQLLSGRAGLVDYDSFCDTECLPSLAIIGAVCVPPSTGGAPAESSAAAGDAAEKAPAAPTAASGSGGSTAAAGAASTGLLGALGGTAADEEAAAEAVAQAAAGARYAREVEARAAREASRRSDTARLRGETAAVLEALESGAARVGADVEAVKHGLALSKAVREASLPAEAGFDAERVAVEAKSTAAAEDAGLAEGVAHAAEEGEKMTVRVTAKLAAEMIEQQARGVLGLEAEAYARRMGWDKPANYGVVLARHSARPYVEFATSAARRASEFEERAEELRQEEGDLQKRAVEWEPHVAAMEAHQDTLGATVGRHELRSLMARSRQLKTEAGGLRKAASEARLGATAWRDAADAAEAAAAAAYGRPPPPADPAPAE